MRRRVRNFPSPIRSVMEAVSNLKINLPRVYGVRPSKRITGVQQRAAVQHIGSVEGERPPFAEVFAQGQIRRGVGRQVGGTAAVDEARAEIDSGCGPEAAWQPERKHRAEAVALVVIEIEV